jgi:predicted Zn-dependent protease
MAQLAQMPLSYLPLMSPSLPSGASAAAGGHVYVQSGLIEAVKGSREAVDFAIGHEVGHSLGELQAGITNRLCQRIMVP